MQLTKKQKRQQRQLQAAGGLDMLDRFDDMTPLLRDGAAAAHAAGIDIDAIVGAGTAAGKAGKAGGKRARGGAGGGRSRGDDGDDDDFLGGDLDGISLPAGGLGGGDADVDLAGGLDEYEEVARGAKERKRARAEDRQVSAAPRCAAGTAAAAHRPGRAFRTQAPHSRPRPPCPFAPTAPQAATLDALRASAPDDETDGDKRAIGRDIAKNKGLTRQRKKLDRNVRTKNREKFRRAVIKRKGQVRDVLQKPTEYGGEATGIKRNVSHSRRFA